MVRDGGLGRPRGSVSSQTQASPPSCAATMETRRSRVGSARALRSRARSAAWLALIGSRSRGGQQTSARLGWPAWMSRIGDVLT